MVTGSIRVLGFLLAACPLWAAVPEAVAEAARGTALAHEGKYESAIQHYKAALRLDPHLPGLYLNLGLAYFKSKRLPEAATAFEEAVRADSNSFQARALLGMSYYGSARYADAAPQLKLASAAQPDNLELRYTLAQSYLFSNQYPEALAEFQFLLSKNPDSAPAHILLGETLDASNRVAAATTEFEAAVKATPVPPDAHFGLGYLYWKQRRFEDACREFEAELAAVPQHAQALAYLGDAEMHTDRAKAAESHLRRALGLDKTLRLAAPGSWDSSGRKERFRRGCPPFSRGDPARPFQAGCSLPFGQAVEFVGPSAGGAGRVREGEEPGGRAASTAARPPSRAAASVNLRECAGRYYTVISAHARERTSCTIDSRESRPLS